MRIEDIKLQSNALHNKEWSRIEGITKKIWNGTIAKSYCFFFFKPLILEAMKKQKLLNEEDHIIFIDNTSIKMSPDANKNKDNQEQSIRRLKKIMTTKLHPCFTSSCSLVFLLSPGNSHDAREGRKLIESICFKNNNYLLMA